MKDWKMIELKDIPNNLADELERLHRLLSESPSLSTWAQKKIDDIHSLLFVAKVFVPSDTTDGIGDPNE